MEVSILVARIISAIYVTGGIAIIMGQLNFNDVVEDINRSPSLSFFSGALGTTFGVILVSVHNTWRLDWTVLITIIGWAMLVGGATVILLPKTLTYMLKYYKHSPAWGVFMIVVGIIFGYLGFFI